MTWDELESEAKILAASVKTVCLYTMSITEIQPDFFIREVQEVQEFPWE